MINFLDLKNINNSYRADFHAALDQVLDSGWFILGQEVSSFEREFADYCQAKECVGVANGLDALVLALRALDIGPGDEVLVPANTYIATWLAVSHVGARPVPVEPLAATANIDVSRLKDALTSRTRAVMPVHLYGQPADLTPLLHFARENGLKVIEDGAQAHGALYRGKRIGGHGDVVAWSFYPGKNLGALGDGGAITTDNTAIADKIRVLRNYGSRTKYKNEVIGFNSRLDELQAAFLRIKLRRLDSDNRHRLAVATAYLSGLADVDVGLPAICAHSESSWHLFVVRHPRRDELSVALEAQGISTVIHYPTAPHLQSAYASLDLHKGALPVSEMLHAQVLSLPIGPTMPLDDVEKVISAVKQSVARLSVRS